MSAYNFNVQIESESIDKAREALNAMISIKKALTHEELLFTKNKMSDMTKLIKAAKANPLLIPAALSKIK